MKKQLLGTLAVATAIAVILPGDAHATGINGMGDQLRQQIGSLTDLIGAAAFIVGLEFGASGLMKFRTHSHRQQVAKLSHSKHRKLDAGALIALPAVLGTSVGTLFANAPSSTTSAGGGNLTGITSQ